ncbi:MAG: leucine-rich repeat domain-containing protein [Clostridia bacterium]|nr:leucine-rich repeat domain-containing protein [Clostridia bacterium]
MELNDHMPDFEIENGVVTAYHGPGGQVIVPEGTIAIGEKAFADAKLITDVFFPDGVVSIGRDAFYWCVELVHVSIPASVTNIGPDAFYGCRNLARIDIAPDNPFFKCEASVIYTKDGKTLVACAGKSGVFKIPEGVTRIESRAFSGCRGLTEIIIPDGVVEIGDYAFSYCTEIRKIAVPGSVKRIGEMAFHFCEHLNTVILAQGVRELGNEVFMDCRELAYVTLPDSLTELGNKAFYYCERLQRLSIPTGITRIGERTFANCGALSSVFLPDTVTCIGEEAFYGCWSLESLELPAHLTEIRQQTFGYCMKLKSITLPAGLQHIADGAFLSCKALTDVSLPDGLVSIDPNAFHGCLALTEVTIPDSVKKVRGFAFSGCTGLVRATYADAIENPDVFSGCTSLREYVVSPRSRKYKAVDGVVLSRDGQKLITYPPGRRCVRYDIPQSVTEVCAWAFSEAPARVVYVHDGVEDFSKEAASGTGEDDPFVASAKPALMTDLGKPIFLGPVEELPPRHRNRVVDGFLAAQEAGMPEIGPWKENYVDYVRQEYRTHEKKAWNNRHLLRLLMEHRMLRLETAKLMYVKFSKTGETELAARLSDYIESTAET